MSEYNIGFSEKLIAAAHYLADQDIDSFDTQQMVLYLSCLACEITLKALLEKAGIPVAKIKKHSHKLSALLIELGRCKVEVEVVKDFLYWVSATRIRGVVVDKRFGNATVGTMLSAEDKGASQYPNEIRYGSSFSHYPPKMMLETADLVVKWAKKHWESIRV